MGVWCPLIADRPHLAWLRGWSACGPKILGLIRSTHLGASSILALVRAGGGGSQLMSLSDLDVSLAHIDVSLCLSLCLPLSKNQWENMLVKIYKE